MSSQVAKVARRLEIENQPRTLRVAGKLDEPQRVSRADEAAITQQVRAAEDGATKSAREDIAGRLRRVEAELKDDLLKLRDRRVRPTKQTYRDLGSAIALIGRVRVRLAPDS